MIDWDALLHKAMLAVERRRISLEAAKHIGRLFRNEAAMDGFTDWKPFWR